MFGGLTTRSVQSQKEDASALAQEVNEITDRVNQIRLTVQVISTVPASTPVASEMADIRKLNTQISELEQQIAVIIARPTATPQRVAELSEIRGLMAQVSALEQQVAAINARPSPTPFPVQIASSNDLEALKARVQDLQKMVEQRPTPEPMTIPTVLAREGIPIDSKLPLVGARASSTNNQLDANEKPVYKPELAIDSNSDTSWYASPGDGIKAWLEIDLDSVRTITGIRFLGGYPVFQDATLIFSNGTAQDLHLTQAQLTTTGWQYFPLVSVEANQIRIVLRALNPHNVYPVSFSEIEVYGK